MEQVTLHPDYSRNTQLRFKLFGHEGVLIPFKEGVIAKKCRIMNELSVYQQFSQNLCEYIPPDLVPTIEGVASYVEGSDMTKTPEVRMRISRDISSPDLNSPVYLMMHDIADGFSKPAVLDVKLGIRTWALGADKIKKERMKRKCVTGTTQSLFFRVRAAIWRSSNPQEWPLTEDVNYVDRKWGNVANESQLNHFFKDFFHFKDMLPYFEEKLSKIEEALVNLRNKHNARLFSASVLFAYDEENPQKFEIKLLDFAKCYFSIDKSASQYNEDVDECEDALIPAIANLKRLIMSLRDKK